MKKFLSILLAVMMLATLAIPAFADTTTGSITIENPVKDFTYSIYQLLDLKSNADYTAFSYTVNETWKDFFSAEKATGALDYVTIDEQGFVSWKDNASEADFAELALAYAEANGINAVQSIKNENSTVVFTELALGYYLVDSSMGALCGLTTTTPNATVKEKNVQPTIDKEVQEDSTEKWGDDNDADLFQTINFRTTINVVAGAQNYVLHDKMEAGLTFIGITSVTVDDVAVATQNYTVTESTGCEDSCTFEIAFDNDYIKGLAEKSIVVSYSGKLNEDAKIYNENNVNETWLIYGDNNETEHDFTYTTTYQFEIVKTDKNNNILGGAEFLLYDAATEGNLIPVVKISDELYRLAGEGETGVTIVIPESGMVTIKGFDGNQTDYYLEETKAPDGYNKLGSRQQFTINNANLESTANEDGSYKEGGVQVVNNTGSELPATGGFGTTLFITVGTILVLGAGVLLVTKKRMSKLAD